MASIICCCIICCTLWYCHSAKSKKNAIKIANGSAEQIRNNQQEQNDINNKSIPPSQIAESGKFHLSPMPQEDMTVTLSKTFKLSANHPSDPTKQHSKYAQPVYAQPTASPQTAIFHGTPNIIEPKSAVEVEVYTDSYRQRLSKAAIRISAKALISKTSNGKNNDMLTEALTPADDNESSNHHKIELADADLNGDEDEFEVMSATEYEMNARQSALQMSRTSSLRNLKGDEKKHFDNLSVYHDTLVEDVVGMGDVTTPASPLTPQRK